MVVVAVVVQMGLATTRHVVWASLWWSDWVSIENSVSRLVLGLFPAAFHGPALVARPWVRPGRPVGPTRPIIL